MKLLKSFGGEEVEMKVVSLLDSTSSMVSTNTPGDEEWGGEARESLALALSGPLSPTCTTWQEHLRPSRSLSHHPGMSLPWVKENLKTDFSRSDGIKMLG